jgi:hypothetical protein
MELIYSKEGARIVGFLVLLLGLYIPESLMEDGCHSSGLQEHQASLRLLNIE